MGRVSRNLIGVVGVGPRGANIARRLKDAGYTISVVYDANRESAETLAREIGAEPADALAEVTSSADVILTVVNDDATMYEIFATSGDSLLEGSRGKTFVNCARVAPQVHVDIERLAESRGARSIEVCMPSSISRARNGTLSWIDRWTQKHIRRARTCSVR